MTSAADPLVTAFQLNRLNARGTQRFYGVTNFTDLINALLLELRRHHEDFTYLTDDGPHSATAITRTVNHPAIAALITIATRERNTPQQRARRAALTARDTLTATATLSAIAAILTLILAPPLTPAFLAATAATAALARTAHLTGTTTHQRSRSRGCSMGMPARAFGYQPQSRKIPTNRDWTDLVHHALRTIPHTT